MQFKKILLIFFLIFYSLNISISNEVRIIAKIDDKIITNIDIENERNYLVAINKNIQNLSENELQILSKNSLIKDIIKQKEIRKFFKIQKNSNLGEKLIKEDYLEKGFKNKPDYLKFLKEKNLNYEKYEKKLIVEKLWNSLVFEKYQNRVKIDELEIEKNLKLFFDNQEKRYEFNLSEIIYDFGTNFNEIKNFILEYNFENAALKYSISNTSSKGGNIGWVDINNLNSNLKNEINNLSDGEITKPFEVSNGYLVLKVNSKREIKYNFNLSNEVKKQIKFERNRQLNSFSINYFKKLRKNTVINEY